jgi:hypothetical protein
MFAAIEHDRRAVLRLVVGRTVEPSAALVESRPVPSPPESGPRAGDDGAQRRREAKGHMAVNTLGHRLAATVQASTGAAVEIACVTQGSTGAQAAQDAQAQHLRLEVIKLPEAKNGFVLRPRRWAVARRNFKMHNTLYSSSG